MAFICYGGFFISIISGIFILVIIHTIMGTEKSIWYFFVFDILHCENTLQILLNYA